MQSWTLKVLFLIYCLPASLLFFISSYTCYKSFKYRLLSDLMFFFFNILVCSNLLLIQLLKNHITFLSTWFSSTIVWELDYTTNIFNIIKIWPNTVLCFHHTKEKINIAKHFRIKKMIFIVCVNDLITLNHLKSCS